MIQLESIEHDHIRNLKSSLTSNCLSSSDRSILDLRFRGYFRLVCENLDCKLGNYGKTRMYTSIIAALFVK